MLSLSELKMPRVGGAGGTPLLRLTEIGGVLSRAQFPGSIAKIAPRDTEKIRVQEFAAPFLDFSFSTVLLTGVK